MRRSIIVTGLAASVSLAAWCGTASAQGVGVDLYVGPPAYDGYYDYPSYSEYRYGPRVYGYTSETGRAAPAQAGRISNRLPEVVETDGPPGSRRPARMIPTPPPALLRAADLAWGGRPHEPAAHPVR